MITVQVVGVGVGPADLSAAQAEVVAKAQLLAGGSRLLAMFPAHPAPRLTLAYNLDAWLAEVAQAAQAAHVVVLASGDPGFYGIAAKVVERLGADHVAIHPGLTTVQTAFARLKEPWQEAHVVSLHGRNQGSDEAALWPACAAAERVAVYTDPAHTPDAIARLLLARGQEHWRMAVLEDLGAPHERVGEYSLAEAAAMTFSPLNLVVLKRLAWPEPLRLGLPEEAYARQGGLITKSEVRALALAKLELAPGLTLWDLGAGSGSLGLEATLLTLGGRVVAVERVAERAAQIRANRQRFGAASLEVVESDLPQALAGLPDPDRVFVGGGGPALAEIILEAVRRLPAGGVLVAAVVMLSSLEVARRALAEAGMEAEVTQAQISRGAALGEDIYLKALNPVWVVKGVKTK
jgi:precorrin-6B C5,15-methyltransferase / cobalt-precorrin-6B C5,C15-methyltransferase